MRAIRFIALAWLAIPGRSEPARATLQAEARSELHQVVALLRSLRDEEPARAEALAGALAMPGEARIEAFLQLLESRRLGPSEDDRSEPRPSRRCSASAARSRPWALRRATGASFPAIPDHWRQWHAEELRWRASRRDAALRGLASRDPAIVVAGIREISERRLGRDAHARELAAVLGRAEPGLRALACGALAELRSPASVAPLVDTLADPRAEVAEAAHAALRRITGRDLPRDPAAWRAARRGGGASPPRAGVPHGPTGAALSDRRPGSS